MNLIEDILQRIDSPLSELFHKVAEGKSVNKEEAYLLYETDSQLFPMLMLLANYLREQVYNKIISYSKNVFIDITHLCRNQCSYCSFRQEPEQLDPLLLPPHKILEIAGQGKESGCHEALFTLGERPELRYKPYKTLLHSIGNYKTTIEYLRDICEKVYLETGLLPHSNPGILEKEEVRELKEVNASLGLMLENSSKRLLEKNKAHEFSPGKDPQLRLATIQYAGVLKVPFTTGILVGVGENYKERIDSIFKIKVLHEKYGHIQEIIIQNFIPKPGSPMQNVPPPPLIDMLKITCLTRIIFKGRMNIQVPPNLNFRQLGVYLMAGINDWGGISPITIDQINPHQKWPSLKKLAKITRTAGLMLRQRLPIYPDFVKKDKFISKLLRDQVRSLIDEDGFVKTI
ncbi:MAG: 7,8-didemethyl-8-hydroxy-5-deazariboflavin synthase CofG [Candidatus Helarchaeota archaeon]